MMVQPAASARSDLACAHGEREVPRGDREDRSDGFLGDQDATVAGRSLRVTSADAYCFLAEPAQEFAAVVDLTAALCQRLTHFQGHHQREVLGAGVQQFEGGAQNLAAYTCRSGRPVFLRRSGEVERTDTVGSGGVGYLGEFLTRCRVVDRKGLLGRDELAAEPETLGYRVEKIRDVGHVSSPVLQCG